jgi:hypothetical protein
VAGLDGIETVGAETHQGGAIPRSLQVRGRDDTAETVHE